MPDNKNIAIVQTAENPVNTPFPASIYQETHAPIPENNISINYPEAESLPPATEEIISENTNIPIEYKSALEKANNYSNIMYMSRAAIYTQLTSEYGEKFTTSEADYAVANLEHQ